MKTKAFFASRLNWFGLIVTAMGILQLVTPFVKALAGVAALDPVAVSEAVVTLLAGILTVVIRTWFTTDTKIKL